MRREQLRRLRRGLTFQIFDSCQYARLDRAGQIIGCSQCRYPYRENLFDLIYRYCRAVNRAGVENPVEPGCDIFPRQEICARCRNREPAETSVNLCEPCLDDIARRGEDGSRHLPVNLSLDFNPAILEPQPRQPKVKQQPKRCASCGKPKQSQTGKWCRKCGDKEKWKTRREEKTHPALG